MTFTTASPHRREAAHRNLHRQSDSRSLVLTQALVPNTPMHNTGEGYADK
jgi:hypothetical protein